MDHSRRWTLALLCVLVATLGIVAPGARASFTPIGGSLTGTATDAAWYTEPLRTPWYPCPRADVAGTVSGAGTISASLTFGPVSRAVQCQMEPLRAVVTWACRGTATLTSTSSIPGVQATGTLTLDSGFSCVATNLGANCTYTISGPQGPFSSWSYDPVRRRLNVAIRTVNVFARGGGSICSGAGHWETWGFAATYALSAGPTVS